VSENPSLWSKIYARMLEVAQRDPYVKVGVLASKGGGEEIAAGGITLVQLLATHEYGDPEIGIPERAPLRRTFAGNRAELARFVAPLARAVMLGKMTIDRALGLLGAWGVSEVKRTIRAGLEPPNAPSTIARKGSSTPLVATGQLVNSISYEIVGTRGGEE